MVLLLATLAVGVATAGQSAPHRYSAVARQSWAAVPVAAREVVARTIAFGDPSYWARRSANGFLLRGAGIQARLSRQSVVLSGGGVSWRLGLQGLGAVAPSASHNRVVYRRRGLSEWYSSSALGIEQGFTVSTPEGPGGTLMLRIGRLPHGLVARIDPGHRGLSLSHRGHGVLRYTDLAATDASGRALPASLRLTGGSLWLRIRVGAARFPVRVDPLVQAADGPVSALGLGGSVAISGNGGTIAVGAPNSTVDGRQGQGAVYVFKRGGSGWASEHEVARLTASDGAANDELGAGSGFTPRNGVAISRDGSTIVAGAPLATVGGHAQAGAAYVFTRPAGGWASEQDEAKLTTSDPGDYDEFGVVAVSGDGRTIAVSASHVDPGSYFVGTGAVYVFTKPAGGWESGQQEAELVPSDQSTSGSPALAISENGSTIVLGASNADYNGDAEEHYYYGDGAAYVFTRPAAGWKNEQQTARLTPVNGELGGAFGNSVAVSADGSTAVVGTPGSVYVFRKRSSGWRNQHPTARLTSSRHVRLSNLSEVVISAGGSTIAVGGPSRDGKRGVVYVFRRRGASWSSAHQLAKLTASPGYPGDSLATSLAVSNQGTIVAGADGVALAQGAAYVFRKRAHGWSSEHQRAKLTASVRTSIAQFAYSVAISADGSTIVVGAPQAHSRAGDYPGAAYVFTKTADGWTGIAAAAKLTAKHGANGDALGTNVAISANGATIAIGAPGARVGKHSNQGAVYVFQEPAGGWASEHQSAQLTASDGGAGDYLGLAYSSDPLRIVCVAISGDGRTIVAGAPIARGGGRLYVFSEPSSGWRSGHQTAQLTSTAGGHVEGAPVAISANGDTIVAGNGQEILLYIEPRAGWAREQQTATLNTVNFSRLDSLAISADGSAVASGDESFDPGIPGRIIVYAKPAVGWESEHPTARLTPPDSADQLLGQSVAFSADGDTIAGSAPGSTGGSTTVPPTVYMFTKPASGWTSEAETAKLTPSDRAAGGVFGAVALSGDGQTLAVAAPGSGASGQGAVYTFAKPSTGWTDEHEAARLNG